MLAHYTPKDKVEEQLDKDDPHATKNDNGMPPTEQATMDMDLKIEAQWESPTLGRIQHQSFIWQSWEDDTVPYPSASKSTNVHKRMITHAIGMDLKLLIDHNP